MNLYSYAHAYWTDTCLSCRPVCLKTFFTILFFIHLFIWQTETSVRRVYSRCLFATSVPKEGKWMSAFKTIKFTFKNITFKKWTWLQVCCSVNQDSVALFFLQISNDQRVPERRMFVKSKISRLFHKCGLWMYAAGTSPPPPPPRPWLTVAATSRKIIVFNKEFRNNDAPKQS